MNSGQITEQEIKQQPETWKETLYQLQNDKTQIIKSLQNTDYKKVILFGSGTSYYLAQTAGKILRHYTGLETRVSPSSEVLLFSDLYIDREETKALSIGFSRSGKTTETVRAARFLKENFDLPVLGFSCHPESSLIETADFSLSFPQAKEESVVMTKSFTSMLVALLELARRMGRDSWQGSLEKLPQLGVGVIQRCTQLVDEIIAEEKYDHFAFLGGGPLYGLASESMLKMKEMALEVTEAFHPLEYRHGPKSTVSDSTFVTIYFSDSGHDQERKLVPELKELGTSVAIIGENLKSSTKKEADYHIEFDSGLGEFARTPLYMPFPHVLGLKRARDKGLDPDSPRNLTQVVELDHN